MRAYFKQLTGLRSSTSRVFRHGETVAPYLWDEQVV